MVSSDATRIASIFTIFLAVATASNMCKKDSDFTSSNSVVPNAGGISCGTLNTYLLGKFSFSPSSWTDAKIDCKSVIATNWARRSGEEALPIDTRRATKNMCQHLWYFGPSCCGNNRENVRHALCGCPSAATAAPAASSSAPAAATSLLSMAAVLLAAAALF
jgi:hypothetical protein